MAIDGIVLAYRGGSGRSQVATASTLSKGCVVFCRSHHHLVEDVQPPEDGGDTAKLILLARLSLDGHGAARLHDEVLELVADVAQLKARLEANAFVKVLQEQRERILKTRTIAAPAARQPLLLGQSAGADRAGGTVVSG